MNKFLKNNKQHKKEIDLIVTKLNKIMEITGAISDFFGTQSETHLVYKLKGTPNLRLYCIRYQNSYLILGGGGYKITQYRKDTPECEKVAKFLERIDEYLKLHPDEQTKLSHGQEIYINEKF